MINRISQWLPLDIERMVIRWAIVAGLLLMAVALPRVASEQEAMLVIMGVAGIGAVWFFLKWPPLGIIATIVGGMIVPFRGPSGLNMAMIILALVLGLWLVEMLLHRKRVSLVPSSTTLPLLVMIVLACVSFGFGQLPWFAFADSAPLGAQVASLAVLILSAGAFLLVGNQVKDVRWLQWIVWTFLAFGALYLLGRAIPEIGSLTSRLFQRGLEGSLFWVWIAVLAFSQMAFNRHLHPAARLALVVLLLLVFYVAYVQTNGWKSGWVPPLIGIGATLIAYSWRLGLLMAPFAAIAGLYLSGSLIESDAYSYSTRIDAWIIMLDLIKESPIFGLGFANYRWFTPLFPIRGYAVYFNSHNQYFDIVAQSGLLGLFSFLWFFLMVGLVGWKLRTRVPEGFQRAYVYGALGGLIATLVAGMLGDWILPYFYNIGLVGFRASMLAWLFLGGLIFLNKQSKDRAESERRT